MLWTQMAPRQPSNSTGAKPASGFGAASVAPALQPEARLPRRRLEIERHEEHQPERGQPQPPARQIGPHQQPGQESPQRDAHGARRAGQQERVQEKR